MIERIKSVIYSFESGRSMLDIYDVALLIKEITEEKLKEEK